MERKTETVRSDIRAPIRLRGGTYGGSTLVLPHGTPTPYEVSFDNEKYAITEVNIVTYEGVADEG